jgi:ABC-type branched-subunit amino acid transport system substrate-binding protein
VPQGQPVRIALAGDSTGSGASFAAGIANAVKMAVEAHPAVRGFPIQIVPVNAPCGDAAADVQAARTITADAQNLAVLGQFCSSGFDQALPIYEAAGVVTITGSATNDALPSFGPTVFDRTAVDDGDGFDSWYAAVSQLPSDVDWQHAYAREFGTAPTQFADLYFDAASLLIRDLQKVSSPDGHGGLVIDRAALAAAVRGTTAFRGVTCTVTFDPKTGNRVNDPAALARCAASIE